MATFKKVLCIIVILLVVCILAASLYVRHLARKGVPDYHTPVQLSRLKDSVTVYRDAYAIPHIYARNESDLYRAFGYCMAQDRLWQMDLLRRVTQGRLAELFGQNLVETDLLMRSLRITAKSEIIFTDSSPEVIAAMQAFSDGINQYIETHRKKLPLEFTLLKYQPEPWHPVHSINLIGYMAWSLTFPWENEVLLHQIKQKVGDQYQELIPDVTTQKTLVHPHYSDQNLEFDLLATLQRYQTPLSSLGLTIFNASNNWALAPHKTKNNQPIFANDMHLGLNSPGIWYQAHHIVEGQLNVTGVALPGAPFIIAGHNAHIAWGFTNVSVDDMDFYLEKINPDNPHQYRFNGQWRPLRIQQEIIQVKDSDPIKREIHFTHRGPIISDFKGIKKEKISMRWTGNEYSDEIRSIYLLNRAQNWADFTNAVRTFRSVNQNVIYSDIHGNIGLYTCAGIPIRKKGQGIRVYPGWTDAYDWEGLVAFEEQPSTYNPDCGFVAAANNKTVANSYPYHISHWFSPPYRIDRIRELLRSKSRLSRDDFKSIQNDNQSKLVNKILPRLLETLTASKKLSPQEKQALDSLHNWNQVYTKNSVAATLFDQFYLCFLENLLADEMESPLFRKFLSTTYLPMYAVENLWHNPHSAWYDDITTSHQIEGFQDIVWQSFRATVDTLSAQLGENPARWQWGRRHRLTLKHPLAEVKILDRLFDLNQGPLPAAGSFHTVGYHGYKFSNPFAITAGASQRHIYTPADWDQSLSIIPTGTCGVPASKHYCDQFPLYMAGQYHRDLFSLKSVRQHAKYTMILD